MEQEYDHDIGMLEYIFSAASVELGKETKAND
jgi:hypothetical protein